MRQYSGPEGSFHGVKQDKAKEGYPTAIWEVASCMPPTTLPLGLLQSLMKSTQVLLSFPPFILSIVIFEEKQLCEGSEMLLEPHQNTAGRGRPVSLSLSPGEKPNNKPVTTSALQGKITGLAGETHTPGSQSRAVPGLGEPFFFFPTERTMRKLSEKVESLTLADHCMIFKAVPVTNCTKQHTLRW